jgi:ribosomal protein S16
VDELGFYNPLLKNDKMDVNKEKVLSWIAKGAMPTDSVRVLLGKAGILPPVSFEGKVKRQPKVKEAQPAEGAAPKAPVSSGSLGTNTLQPRLFSSALTTPIFLATPPVNTTSGSIFNVRTIRAHCANG